MEERIISSGYLGLVKKLSRFLCSELNDIQGVQIIQHNVVQHNTILVLPLCLYCFVETGQSTTLLRAKRQASATTQDTAAG